jgi:biopolymer transport protein TolR
MLRRRRRQELTLNSDINLINLVDLAFVLLIIFMITAPMLQAGIDIQLPKSEATPVASDEGVMVTIDPRGTIYLGQVPIKSLADLETTFPSYMKRTGKKEAYLRGDQRVNYGRVLEVLGVMKRLNVAEVSLVVDPVVRR